MGYVGIRIDSLTKRFPSRQTVTAVDDVTLEIDKGEFIVLLGPSGCGKSTTLRCLAGLETPDAGAITFGDRCVFDSDRRINIPPEKRKIGMVFQSYALWPHMTVRKNINYPLRAQRIPAKQSAGWVENVAAQVDCTELLDRLPSQLSGGQQQRVALARGLVARPELVLFDEPLSNLDARLRDQVRSEIHELHSRLGFTAVFVTHDQSEALALGDRLVVMRSGRLEQTGTPEELFEQPATEYVAGFIGMANRLVLQRTEAGWSYGSQIAAAELPLARSRVSVALRFRPEDLTLLPAHATIEHDTVHLAVEVFDVQFGGRHMDVQIGAEGSRLHCRLPSGAADSWARRLHVGQRATACLDSAAVGYFDLDGNRVAAPEMAKASA